MRTAAYFLLLSVALAAMPAARAQSPSTPATVVTKSALEELTERREGGLVFVVVSNISKTPITIERIWPLHASFLEVVPELEGPAFNHRAAENLSLVVPPGHSQALPFRVAAKSAVEPGNQMVLWQVELSWSENGREQRGNLVAESRFKVEVLGESEVLNSLKVPSLFLLPGVLMLLGYRGAETLEQWLRKLREAPPKEEASSPQRSILELLHPGYAALAVLLSLGMAFVYPKLTGWRGEPRDLLVRYGLEDIYYVFLLSLGLGAVGYLLVLSWRKACKCWKDRRTPTKADTPLVTLRKLARRGVDSVSLEQVKLGGAGGPRSAFVLARQDGQIWLAPPMRLEWRVGRTGAVQDRLEEVLESGGADETASFFEKSGELALLWRSAAGDSPGGPWSVSAGDVKEYGTGVRRIIEV